MGFKQILLGLLILSPSVMADTLYQANMGGYSTGVGVGLGTGFGIGPNGYSPGVSAGGVPYDNFTYPYSSGCCGCNTCNNCDTSYSTRYR